MWRNPKEIMDLVTFIEEKNQWNISFFLQWLLLCKDFSTAQLSREIQKVEGRFFIQIS